jgi:hypothetical protein
MKTLAITLLGAAAASAAAHFAAPFVTAGVPGVDPPALLQYQARLLTPAGVPVSSPSLAVTFRIYDTPLGGTALYTEPKSVAVAEGLLSTVIGDTFPLPDTLFENDAELYLGVQIGSDSEMVPRHRFATVPYAIRAKSASSADDVPGMDITPGSVTINGVLVIDSTGAWVGSPTGLVGPTGPAGAAGPTGPAGPIGLTGATGPIGSTGPMGAVGATGPMGAVGATGPMGPVGLTGAMGPAGPTGPVGPMGVQGPIGLTGPAGAVGATGPTGPAGPGIRFNDDGTSGWGIDPPPGVVELYAIPTIWRLRKVGGLHVRGEDPTVPVTVYEVDMISGTRTVLGSGTVNSFINIIDFLNNAPSTLYLLVKVELTHPTAQTIYGGVMYDDDVGTVESDFIIKPTDFFVDNDV